MLHPCESLCQTLSVDIKYIDIAKKFTTQWAKMCIMLDFCKPEKNRAYVIYTFGHISVKQRQLSDQQVDSGPWIVQLCENNSGLNSQTPYPQPRLV